MSEPKSPKTKGGRHPREIRPLGSNELYQSSLHLLNHYIGTTVRCRYRVPNRLFSSTSTSTSTTTSGPEPDFSSARPDRQELKNFFRRAVTHTIFQHPLLCVGLYGEDSKKPVWVQLDNIDLDRHIRWEEEDEVTTNNYEARLHRTLTEELDTKFTNLETVPGWRIVVFVLPPSPSSSSPSSSTSTAAATQIEVLYTWNHANHDGTGGKIFHQTLLKSLNSIPPLSEEDKVTNSNNNNIISLSSSFRKNNTIIPPPQQSLAKFPLTPSYTIKTAWRGLRPQFLAGKKAKGEGDGCDAQRWCPILLPPSSGTIPCKTHVRTFWIGEKEMSRMVGRCRGEGTTFTGMLHGVCGVVFSGEVGGGEEGGGFKCGTAVCMRRFLPPPPAVHLPEGAAGEDEEEEEKLDPKRTMANYVSNMDHVIDGDWVGRIREAESEAGKKKNEKQGKGKDGKEEEEEEMLLLLPLVWEVARMVRGEISRRMELGLKNDITGVMKFVGDWRTVAMDTVKKPRVWSWSVTNLGVMDGDGDEGGEKKEGEGEKGEEETWTIEGAGFHLGAEVPCAALCVSPIAVKGKGLCMSFSWQDGVMEVEMAERIIGKVMGWLEVIGREAD